MVLLSHSNEYTLVKSLACKYLVALGSRALNHCDLGGNVYTAALTLKRFNSIVNLELDQKQFRSQPQQEHDSIGNLQDLKVTTNDAYF